MSAGTNAASNIQPPAVVRALLWPLAPQARSFLCGPNFRTAGAERSGSPVRIRP